MLVVTLRELLDILSRLGEAVKRGAVVLFAIFVGLCLLIPKYSPLWYTMKQLIEYAIVTGIFLFIIALPAIIIWSVFRWIFWGD